MPGTSFRPAARGFRYLALAAALGWGAGPARAQSLGGDVSKEPAELPAMAADDDKQTSPDADGPPDPLGPPPRTVFSNATSEVTLAGNSKRAQHVLRHMLSRLNVRYREEDEPNGHVITTRYVVDPGTITGPRKRAAAHRLVIPGQDAGACTQVTVHWHEVVQGRYDPKDRWFRAPDDDGRAPVLNKHLDQIRANCTPG